MNDEQKSVTVKLWQYDSVSGKNLTQMAVTESVPACLKKEISLNAMFYGGDHAGAPWLF